MSIIIPNKFETFNTTLGNPTVEVGVFQYKEGTVSYHFCSRKNVCDSMRAFNNKNLIGRWTNLKITNHEKFHNLFPKQNIQDTCGNRTRSKTKG